MSHSGFFGWSLVLVGVFISWGSGCAGSESSGAGAASPTGSDCSPDGSVETCYAGDANTRNIGECRDGSRTCQGGKWGACSGAILPVDEVCSDLLDNDCNGASDDGCPCDSGTTRPCYSGPAVTRGIGICREGAQSCESDTWGSDCAGELLPQVEDPCNDLDDDCDGVVEDGSDLPECCVPSCESKTCGAGNGCGSPCQQGSGCCPPACSGKLCGEADGCGGTCQQGSGCCSPSCASKLCGAGDGCGGTCQQGSGCCSPSCSGAQCGDSDGCGGTCSGPCPWKYFCNGSLECECGPSPSFVLIGGNCVPSCGALLNHLNLPSSGDGCCPTPCQAGTFAGGPGATHDCTYCCSSQGSSTCT